MKTHNHIHSQNCGSLCCTCWPTRGEQNQYTGSGYGWVIGQENYRKNRDFGHLISVTFSQLVRSRRIISAALSVFDFFSYKLTLFFSTWVGVIFRFNFNNQFFSNQNLLGKSVTPTYQMLGLLSFSLAFPASWFSFSVLTLALSMLSQFPLHSCCGLVFLDYPAPDHLRVQAYEICKNVT